MTTKSSKILWYLSYEENFAIKIKLFISKVIYLMLSMYKLNFEIYYNNNINDYFFFI